MKIRKVRIHRFGGPETRERSWQLLKRGGTLATTLTEPSQERATQQGVRAPAGRGCPSMTQE